MAELLKINIEEPSQILPDNLEKTTQEPDNERFACKINEIRKKKEAGDEISANKLSEEIINEFESVLSSQAKKYTPKNNPLISREDLIQEGKMGIMQAIKEHDGKGKFTAWAAISIRRNMIDFIRKNNAEVSGIGREDQTIRYDKKRVKKSYLEEDGISNEARDLLGHHEAAKKHVYIDKNVGGENDTIGDFLASKHGPDSRLLRADEKKIIEEAFEEILTFREDRKGSGLPTDWSRNIEIIKYYFGLNGGEQLNEKQIAEKFGITEGGVSYALKIIKQEIKKRILLRHPDFSF